jgi:hypothetical protein
MCDSWTSSISITKGNIRHAGFPAPAQTYGITCCGGGAKKVSYNKHLVILMQAGL